MFARRQALTGAAAAALPAADAGMNHNLIEAVEPGATAYFVVEDEWSGDLVRQVEAPGPVPIH